jgi:glycine oxidase
LSSTLTPTQLDRPDVLVVGGGAIGLASAWRLAQAGLRVALADPSPGRGASWAAAGLLAPVTELHYGEEALLRLNLASAQMWPAFADELEQATGITVGYRQVGTLSVAADTGDAALLGELVGFQHSLGLRVSRLSARECRELEPALAPGIRGGALVEDDHQVDNRRLVEALAEACRRAGVRLVDQEVTEIVVRSGRVEGVRLGHGERVSPNELVLCAGCWTPGLAGLPPDLVLPVRPVKGQILRLRDSGESPSLGRNVRGWVSGYPVYLVPRADGGLVVGASVEERGFDRTVRAGTVYELLRDAIALVPAVAELELTEASCGLRPGSPDNAPLIGRTPLEGLTVAAGHFRNGILLTPLTARAVACLLTGAQPPAGLEAASPARFEPEVAGRP